MRGDARVARLPVMSRLTPEEYRSFVESESRRFRDTLAGCDPAAPVPACPDWNAADLLWHLTEVQDFWARVVERRPDEPDPDGRRGRPTDHVGLLAGFDRASASLCAALEGAEPSEQAWTWSEDHTVGFVLRRQALEALVHRIDAEQTAGVGTDVDARLAADGVEEVLDVMYGACPPWGSFSPLPHHVRVDVIDTDDSVWVQLGRFSGTDPEGIRHDEDDIAVVADPGTEPDAVISGRAAPLLTRLWRRGDGADIQLAGDLEIVDHFRQVIHQPIN
jgi:uncharacterized protein (TIGR03083 family)